MKHADKADLFLHFWRIVAGTDKRVPQPTPEYRFDPERKWRLDWAWPEPIKVGVEVDGGVFAPGGGRHAKDADREKTNALAAAGWLVFRFSPQMLENDPTYCVMMVAETVWERGLK